MVTARAHGAARRAPGAARAERGAPALGRDAAPSRLAQSASDHGGRASLRTTYATTDSLTLHTHRIFRGTPPARLISAILTNCKQITTSFIVLYRDRLRT